MMKKYVYILVILQFSCMSTYPSTSPYGVQATIKLIDNRTVSAELIEFTNDSLYFMYQSRLFRTHISDTRKIHLKELEAPARGASLILSGLVSTITGIGAFAADDALAYGLFFTSVGVLSMSSGFRGNPLAICKYPLDELELNRLISACRYPQGLSPGQRRFLLNKLRQDNCFDAIDNTIPRIDD